IRHLGVKMELDNKRVVVIGGSSGIGLGIALASYKAGAEVIIASRSQEKLNHARNMFYEEIQTHIVDLSEEESIVSLANQLGEIDHLVVSAGQVAWGSFIDLPTEDARKAFDLNFWGKYMSAKAIAPQMRQGGSITFISGVFGHKPAAGAVGSSASLSAIESLGRALAVALSPLRVNSITPALVDTPMIMPDASNEERSEYFKQVADSLPAKTIGDPKDIGNAAIMLMTNPFMTGSTLMIDGGYTLS
ncbi:MAG: SDR family oxidoreductase, partial [Chloroflexota bacterium]